MDLNNFSSYFEIFTGLNLAYAGSKTFQNAVNENFLALDQTLSTKIKEKGEVIISQLLLLIAAEHKGRALENVSKIDEKFKEKWKKIEQDEQYFKKFPQGNKSMFLITGLFCLAILLLGGFRQFFVNQEETPAMSLFFLNLILIYNLIIFLRSFIHDYCNKNLNSLFPVASIVLLVSSIIYISNYCSWINSDGVYELMVFPKAQLTLYSNSLSKKCLISIALLTAASPFMLHFLRVFIHKYSYRLRFRMLWWRTDRQLTPIQKAIESLSK